jgi:Zn-finger nucleic acid-binding protein
MEEKKERKFEPVLAQALFRKIGKFGPPRHFLEMGSASPESSDSGKVFEMPLLSARFQNPSGLRDGVVDKLCPSCQVELETFRKLNWLASGPAPLIALRCPKCRQVWIKQFLLGPFINISRKPSGLPMGEFLNDPPSDCVMF